MSSPGFWLAPPPAVFYVIVIVAVIVTAGLTIDLFLGWLKPCRDSRRDYASSYERHGDLIIAFFREKNRWFAQIPSIPGTTGCGETRREARARALELGWQVNPTRMRARLGRNCLDPCPWCETYPKPGAGPCCSEAARALEWGWS